MGAHLRPGRPLRANVENNAEARLAAHHPLIGGLGRFERKNLIHRSDVVGLAEQKRIFLIGRSARVPTAH